MLLRRRRGQSLQQRGKPQSEAGNASQSQAQQRWGPSGLVTAQPRSSAELFRPSTLFAGGRCERIGCSGEVGIGHTHAAHLEADGRIATHRHESTPPASTRVPPAVAPQTLCRETTHDEMDDTSAILQARPLQTKHGFQPIHERLDARDAAVDQRFDNMERSHKEATANLGERLVQSTTVSRSSSGSANGGTNHTHSLEGHVRRQRIVAWW